MQEKTEFINRCPLFSSWSARLKRLVSLNLERGRFSYDGILFKQGSRADCVYFIWKYERTKRFFFLSTSMFQRRSEIDDGSVTSLAPISIASASVESDATVTRSFFRRSSSRRARFRRALDFFLPTLQPTEPSNVHIPSASTVNGHRQSFAIKRRHMTFAQAEKERHQRIVQLALLGTGDIIGLDAFVCDLSTYMNTARCTAPCDLFYILKHNFVRLQKRHGTQGLTERLKDIVRLSVQAYPQRISHLPLFDVLVKKFLSNEQEDEQHPYHSKQSWLLHVSHSSPTVKIVVSPQRKFKNVFRSDFASIRSEIQSIGGKIAASDVQRDATRVHSSDADRQCSGDAFRRQRWPPCRQTGRSIETMARRTR